jgi:hypothetical protein
MMLDWLPVVPFPSSEIVGVAGQATNEDGTSLGFYFYSADAVSGMLRLRVAFQRPSGRFVRLQLSDVYLASSNAHFVREVILPLDYPS